MGTHTWMWSSKDEKQLTQDTVTLPVLVGIAVVFVTVSVFYLLHKRPSIAGRTGTHSTLEGGKIVRRSARSRKGVSRWSPDDLGTPTGMKDEREKSDSILSAVTPTQLVKKVKAEIGSPLATSTRKTRAKTSPTVRASPPSPPRTRRAAAGTPGRH